MSSSEIKTVYVGDIINSADEEFLRDTFGPPNFGNIVSLNLNKKDKPGENCQYAFITYESQAEAQKVVDEMNYISLNGHEIRVSLASPNFSKILSSGAGNITLRNISEDITQSQLHEAFSQFGEVISVRIPRGKNGEHYGVAYIQFKKEKDAEQALTEMQGLQINGVDIIIEKFNPADNSPNIHIKGGIPVEVETNQNLIQFLKDKVNEEKSDGDNDNDDDELEPLSNLMHSTLLKLPNDPDYRQAYLTFTDLESTRTTLELLKKAGLTCERVTNPDKINHMKQNSSIWEKHKAQENQQRCLYVKNIPFQYTEDLLIDFFSQFSDVTKCNLKNSTDSKFAYVYFRTPEGAKHALKKSVLACSHFKKGQRNNKKYPTQLYVAPYTTKEDQIKASYNQRQKFANKKELQDRIIRDFGEDSMQYERFKLLSMDQISALSEDQSLYQDWADEENNQPYEDDFDYDYDEEEEEYDEFRPRSSNIYSRSKDGNQRGGNFQKGGRGTYNQRGGGNPQRGGRGTYNQRAGRGNNRGGRGRFSYTPNRGGRGRGSHAHPNYFDDDDDDLD